MSKEDGLLHVQVLMNIKVSLHATLQQRLPETLFACRPLRDNES